MTQKFHNAPYGKWCFVSINIITISPGQRNGMEKYACTVLMIGLANAGMRTKHVICTVWYTTVAGSSY